MRLGTDPRARGRACSLLDEAMTEALAAVLAPRESGRSLPRAAFVEPESFALDVAAHFADGWLAAAHGADLADPGAWARVPSPGRGDLAITRTAELGLALLTTVCRHRGVPLLEGGGGRAHRLELVCPYHGWTYDLGGALLRAPGLAASCDRAMLGLGAGRVAQRGPLVFASTAATGGSVPSLPPWLERAELTMLRRAHVSSVMVHANWKLLVGNFQESHHFPHVHPALEARTPFASSSSVTPSDGGWLGGVMELRADLETVSGSGRRDGRPFIAAPDDRRRVHDAWIAPNLLTSLQPDYLLSYRLEPEAHDRTRVVFAIDVHAGAAEADVAAGIDDLVAFWSNVNAEDRAICEAQQRGLASAPYGHPAGPRVESEDGLDAFEKRIASAYLALRERTS